MTEPIELFTQIQPLIEKTVDDKIDQFANDKQFSVADVPAHTHTGTDSNRVSYNSLTNKTRYILYRIVSPTTDTSIANTVGGNFVMPFQGYVTSVGATVDTAGTTGTTTVDINLTTIAPAATSSILLTKITIDSTENSSRTAATPSVLDSSKVNFSTGDIFTFDVDAVSTTPAKGLTIFMNVVEMTPKYDFF